MIVGHTDGSSYMLYGWQVIEVVSLKDDWSTGQSYRHMDSLSCSLGICRPLLLIGRWSDELMWLDSVWLVLVNLVKFGQDSSLGTLLYYKIFHVPLAKLASSSHRCPLDWPSFTGVGGVTPPGSS